MSKPIRTVTKFLSITEAIVLAYCQALDALKEGGLQSLLRPRLFWKRKATPVEMDLASVTSTANILRDSSYQFIELKLEILARKDIFFITPSRAMKALRNLRRGWRGFALVQGKAVAGDVWCVAPSQDGDRVAHPDLTMLDITCGHKEAYAFDMYIAPDHRGENLAGPFQRLLQAALKEDGCLKVYGYYWDDNLPALWMHRILKFKELPKRQISRFLFYQKAETITGAARLAKPSTSPPIRRH